MTDSVVVVTGASSGLGAAMAQEFSSRGCSLGLCSRRPPALPSGERVLARQLDIREPAAVEEFADAVVDRFGRIDLWINNAGVLEPVKSLADADVDEWWRLVEINLRGVALGSRAFARYVRTSGHSGVLINISSGAATSAYAGWSAYCASKAAVDLLTRCVALEERQAGLRAYSVAPGIIDTQMQTQIRAASPADFPQVDKFIALKEKEEFSSPAHVARELLAIAFERRPDEVLLRLPPG